MGRKGEAESRKFPVLLMQKGSVGADSAFFMFAVFSLKWEWFPMRLDWLDLQVEHSPIPGEFYLFFL